MNFKKGMCLILAMMLVMIVFQATAKVEPPAQLVERAEKEGNVIYTYAQPESWSNYGGVYALFAQLYGIEQQDIDMGSSVVLSRMTEEEGMTNDIADLSARLARVLARRGLTSQYKISCWDIWPEGQCGEDPDTHSVWYAAYWGTLAFLVNTDLIDPVPASWKDLKNPTYKGLIAYMDPRATATGVTTVESAAYAVSGDPYDYKAGVDFLKELHDMNLINSIDPLVTVGKFQRGEVGILMNFDFNLLKWKYDNPEIPSVVVIPQDGTISPAYAVVAAKYAPHPYIARLALEHILCGEGQVLFAESFAHPMNPTVEIPEEVAAKMPPPEAYDSAIFTDYTKEEEIIEDLQQYYDVTIGG